MVKKINQEAVVKIPKPVVDIDGVNMIMDQQWYDHIEESIEKISKEFPIRKVFDSDYDILIEFKNAKIATLYRLKYGDQRQ